MSVHFKFKSEKEFGTINFPGTTIRVIDLKKGIIEQKKLNKGQDMELVITDFQNNTVYEDDNQQLTKNTSVIVKRMPAKNNVGILARIAAEQKASAPPHTLLPVPALTPALPSLSEDDNQAASASTGAETVEDELEALNAIQQEAEEARNVRGGGNKTWTAGGGGFKGGPPGMYAGGRGGGFGGRGPPPMGGRGGGGPMQPPSGDNSMDTPPQGYVCYRCGVPGHFIQNCPTNGNANHDKHMVKPRTGIPTSLIKAVEGPNQAPGFTVVNTGPNGGLAIVVPQVKAFEKLVKSSGGGSGIDQYRLVPPDHLACPICKRLMQDAVLIPCCHESACDGCIRDALISHNLTCPLCRKAMSPENLIPNKGTRSSVDEFLKRSQGEAQERERLVKEAEAKALQKQLEVEDTTAQRRVEIADAVLDISKKPKDDDDDDLGGDLFADEPEQVESPTKEEKVPDPQPAPVETAPTSGDQPPPSTASTATEVKQEEGASTKPDGDKPHAPGPPPGGHHHGGHGGPPPGWRPHGGPPPGWFDGPPRPWFDGPPPPWAAGGHFGHPPPHMFYDGGFYGGPNPPPWMRPPPGYGGGRDRSADRKGDKGDGKGSPRSKSRRSRERRRSSRDRKSSRHRSRSRSRRRDRSTERESSRKSATRDSKADGDKDDDKKRESSDRGSERKKRSSSIRREPDAKKEGSVSRRGSERASDDRDYKDRRDDGDRKDRSDDKRHVEKRASTTSEKSRRQDYDTPKSEEALSPREEKTAPSKPVEAPAIDLDFLEDDHTAEEKPLTKIEPSKRDSDKDSSRRKPEGDDRRDDRRDSRDDRRDTRDDRRDDTRSDRHDRHESDRKTSDRKSGDHRRDSDRKDQRPDDRKSKGDDRRRGDKKDDGVRDGDRKDRKSDKKRSSERPSSRDDKRGSDGKRRRSRSRERSNRSSERKVVKKVEAEEPPKKKRSVFERLGPAVKK